MKKKKEIEVNKTVAKQYLYRRKAYDEMAELCYGAKTFNSYAGRGIHVCDDWKNAYDNFVVDMGDSDVPPIK